MCKYADHYANVLVPEHTNVLLVDEFLNFRSWAKRNKMVIKFAETTDHVPFDSQHSLVLSKLIVSSSLYNIY